MSPNHILFDLGLPFAFLPSGLHIE